MALLSSSCPPGEQLTWHLHTLAICVDVCPLITSTFVGVNFPLSILGINGWRTKGLCLSIGQMLWDCETVGGRQGCELDDASAHWHHFQAVLLSSPTSWCEFEIFCTLVLWSGRPRFDISVPGQATAMTPLVLCHSWASFACFYDLLRVNTLWTFKQIQSEPTSISIQ